jgi:hypothetical protein
MSFERGGASPAITKICLQQAGENVYNFFRSPPRPFFETAHALNSQASCGVSAA